MLKCYLLDSDNKIVGTLEDDFTFTPDNDAYVAKASFYKGDRHLFVTEFDQSRLIHTDDTLVAKFDSGIDFHYLIYKLREPKGTFENRLKLFRGLLKVIRRIKYERQARDQLDTWDPQVYKILFDEKQ